MWKRTICYTCEKRKYCMEHENLGWTCDQCAWKFYLNHPEKDPGFGDDDDEVDCTTQE